MLPHLNRGPLVKSKGVIGLPSLSPQAGCADGPWPRPSLPWQDQQLTRLTEELRTTLDTFSRKWAAPSGSQPARLVSPLGNRGRESLDIRRLDPATLLAAKGLPRGQYRWHAPRGDHCGVKIAVKRQTPAWRRATFEHGFGEVAGLWVKKRSALALDHLRRGRQENAVAYVERFLPRFAFPTNLPTWLSCAELVMPQATAREDRRSAYQQS